jgi:hypothetical protein
MKLSSLKKIPLLAALCAGALGTSNAHATSATLQQIKTIFVIALENHDWTQANPTGSPQQIKGNPAAPYVNSLTTPGNSNAVHSSYATAYYNVGRGVHPSEPNYIYSEAGTSFGTYTDNDPSSGSGNQFSNKQHLTGQLTAAGVAWKSYQEDLEYTLSEEVSASGTGKTNPYNGTTEYAYAVKHNPPAFFTDTQNKNCYPLTNFWADLTNNNLGRYNWITPDLYNEMHSSLPSGYTYHGTNYTGDQAAIAEGDNCLSIIVPKIMASQAYQSNGVIIIWTDETESTDDTDTTLPFIVISPLAKGNAYASSVALSHNATLKTMDEIFGLAFQTNAIPDLDAQGTGYNVVSGCNDLSDLFQTVSVTNPVMNVVQAGTMLANGGTVNFGSVNLGFNAITTFYVTNAGNAALTVSNVVVTGTNAGDFSVNGITLPATVAAAGTTMFNGVFAPIAAGTRTATLKIMDNDPNNNPFNIVLTGTGIGTNTYTLTYTAGANGTISGTSPQTVNSGASGTAVTAVANSGYHFVNWSDSKTANPRTDTNVTSNISVTANFAGTNALAYTQNFNAALTNSATALPPGFTSMVIAGANSTYTATNPITAAAIASATADTQTLLIWNVGTAVAKSGTQSYNIGCWDSLTDRALGTDPTGTAAQVIQLSLTNKTGATINGVTFRYDCKCLTNGSAGTEQSELPGYAFFYSTTGTTSATNWTEVGGAGNNFLSNGIPVANGLCLPNFTQGTTMSSGPVNITFVTPLTNNGVMYFRWADDNNVANSPDQMIGIDNISITSH